MIMNFEPNGSCDQKMLSLKYFKCFYNFISTLALLQHMPKKAKKLSKS